MACHRIEELIELLEPEWQKEPDLHLLQFLSKLAKEAGFNDDLNNLSDEILIYHLKMRNADKTEAIPWNKKRL